jgi:hypothetical protein
MAMQPVPWRDSITDAVGKASLAWLQFFRAIRDFTDGVLSGTGSPENVITAPIGTLYRRLDGGAGTCLYVKESGVSNTGWIAK